LGHPHPLDASSSPPPSPRGDDALAEIDRLRSVHNDTLAKWRSTVGERDEARKSCAFWENRENEALKRALAAEASLAEAREANARLAGLLNEMAPHVDKIAWCAPINDEMGRVVTGQVEAARALADVFSRALAFGEGA